MAFSRQTLEAELSRRGALPAGPAPQASRDDIAAELRRRGVDLPISDEQALSNRENRGDIASAELGESRRPGVLDYIPGVGLLQDIPDIVEHGYGSAPIRARKERRERAAKTAVPYVASAAGATLATPVSGPATVAGIAGRAALSALGSAGGDAVGQVVTEGEIDPRQTAAAALGGALGQPAGEAVGAAVPAAVRGLMRGGETGRQGVQAAIDDAARVGQVPTVAQATQSSFLDGLESLLAKTPGGAGRIRDRVRDTTAAVRSSIEDIAQQGTGRIRDAESAGQAVIGGVRDFSERLSNRAEPLFEAVTSRVGADTPVAASNTLRTLDDLTTPIAGAEATSQRFVSSFIRGLADDLATDAGASGALPFHALQKVRSLVGRELGDTGLRTDVPKAQLKQVYAAISDDIRTAAKAAGADATHAFNRANDFYRSGMARVERTLEPLVRNKVPEKVFDAIVSGSRSGPTQIRTLYRSLSSEQQDTVTGAIIRRLGTATPGQQGAEGAEFSFSTFLTRWNQIDEGARNAVFRRGRNVQLGDDINALARYAERVRESSHAFANPSGTSGALLGGSMALLSGGSVIMSPVLGAGVLTLPLIFGSGAAGANVAARLMTSPRVVHWLAQATRLKPHGIGAHIGRLSAIAAKEDPDVQQAIGDYLDMLQEAPHAEN